MHSPLIDWETTPLSVEFQHIDLSQVWSREPDPIDWVLPGLATGTVGNVVAPGGAGKSFLMLATALSVGIGGDVGNIWGEPLTAGPSVFLSLEDAKPELHLRLHNLAKLLTEEEKQAAQNHVRILSAVGSGFTLAMQGPNRESKRSERFSKFSDYLCEIKPRLLVIDTLNRAIGGLAENDAGAMGWLLAQLESLASDACCSIILCHHVSKSAAAFGGSNPHAARGSSAITDNARWQANMTLPTEDDVRDRKVKWASHVRLKVTKANYRASMDERWLRRETSGVLVFDDSVLRRQARSITRDEGRLADVQAA